MRLLPAGDDPDVHSVSSDDDTAAKQSVVAQQDVAQQTGHEIVTRFASCYTTTGVGQNMRLHCACHTFLHLPQPSTVRFCFRGGFFLRRVPYLRGIGLSGYSFSSLGFSVFGAYKRSLEGSIRDL